MKIVRVVFTVSRLTELNLNFNRFKEKIDDVCEGKLHELNEKCKIKQFASGSGTITRSIDFFFLKITLEGALIFQFF